MADDLDNVKKKDTVKLFSTVDVRFRDLLMELTYDVVHGAKLADAKHKLHSFVDELSDADKAELYSKTTVITTRIRDIATSLTGEAPSLLAKMQPKEN